TFLGFAGDRVTAADCDALCDAADKAFARPDWEAQVFRRTNLEKIFLTNEFDDPLEKYNTGRYVPCLRTDTLVFQLQQPDVKQRLAKATGVEVGDLAGLKRALARLFERFVGHGAKACAISLPPDFAPDRSGEFGAPPAAFRLLAECCREFKLPFDL